MVPGTSQSRKLKLSLKQKKHKTSHTTRTITPENDYTSKPMTSSGIYGTQHQRLITPANELPIVEINSNASSKDKKIFQSFFVQFFEPASNWIGRRIRLALTNLHEQHEQHEYHRWFDNDNRERELDLHWRICANNMNNMNIIVDLITIIEKGN